MTLTPPQQSAKEGQRDTGASDGQAFEIYTPPGKLRNAIKDIVKDDSNIICREIQGKLEERGIYEGLPRISQTIRTTLTPYPIRKTKGYNTSKNEYMPARYFWMKDKEEERIKSIPKKHKVVGKQPIRFNRRETSIKYLLAHGIVKKVSFIPPDETEEIIRRVKNESIKKRSEEKHPGTNAHEIIKQIFGG